MFKITIFIPNIILTPFVPLLLFEYIQTSILAWGRSLWAMKYLNLWRKQFQIRSYPGQSVLCLIMTWLHPNLLLCRFKVAEDWELYKTVPMQILSRLVHLIGFLPSEGEESSAIQFLWYTLVPGQGKIATPGLSTLTELAPPFHNKKCVNIHELPYTHIHAHISVCMHVCV